MGVVAKRQLVAEQWNEFARTILPPGCSDLQRQEIQRAFYAGAQAILFRAIYTKLSPNPRITAGEAQMMEDLHQELQDFAAAVKAGRA